jgi:cobalt/nickel transport system permease protein
MTALYSSTVIDSTLARWDARWKLAGLLSLALSSAIVQSIPATAFALALAVLLAVCSRLPVRTILTVASVILVGVVPLAVAIPLLGSHGMGEGIALILRALAVGLIGHVAVATAPPHRTFAALAAMRVPRLLVLLLQFSFRYSILLAGELRRIRMAMAVRGFRLKPNVRSLSTLGNGIGSVLVRGGERAEIINHAMHARGFDGHIRMLTAFQTTGRDVIAFAVVLGLAVAVFVLDRWAFAC